MGSWASGAPGAAGVAVVAMVGDLHRKKLVVAALETPVRAAWPRVSGAVSVSQKALEWHMGGGKVGPSPKENAFAGKRPALGRDSSPPARPGLRMANEKWRVPSTMR